MVLVGGRVVVTVVVVVVVVDVGIVVVVEAIVVVVVVLDFDQSEVPVEGDALPPKVMLSPFALNPQVPPELKAIAEEAFTHLPPTMP